MNARQTLAEMQRKEAEIQQEVNKEWLFAILVIVYIIILTIFIALLCDFGQAINHYETITTPAINHPPVFIR